jgi:hypothetical protein
MFVPACDRPTVAAPTGTEGRHVMESESATMHRKMRALYHQLPITGSAHNATAIRDDGMTARLVLAARDIATKRRGTAGLDGAHHLQLRVAHVTAVGVTPSGAEVAEDLGDLQSRTLHECVRLLRWVLVRA